MQRKSNTSPEKRHKYHCSLPYSCPSLYKMNNLHRAGTQSQPTGFVIIKCLSFIVQLIACKHHSLPHILLHCEPYPIIKQDKGKQCHNNINIILYSAALKKEKLLKENSKCHPTHWKMATDQVKYLEKKYSKYKMPTGKRTAFIEQDGLQIKKK